jgi:hypothetical protein
MSDQIDAFLAIYSREAREIALCLRKLISDVFPTGVKHIDSKSAMMIYGFDEKTYKGVICAIAPHMKHVNLIFTKGTQIPDPSRLLNGTGKLVRHIKIRSEAETENPALRLLLEEALKLKYNE